MRSVHPPPTRCSVVFTRCFQHRSKWRAWATSPRFDRFSISFQGDPRKKSITGHENYTRAFSNSISNPTPRLAKAVVNGISADSFVARKFGQKERHTVGLKYGTFVECKSDRQGMPRSHGTVCISYVSNEPSRGID